MVLGNLGRYIEAIPFFEKVTELEPKNEKAWHNKGAALFNLGRFEEAIPVFEKALELNPKYQKAWFNKGQSLENLGKNRGSIAGAG